MNYFFYLLFLQIFPNSSFIRTQENATSAIHYKFNYMVDTLNPTRLYSENMVLYIGANSSAYESFDKIQMYSKANSKDLEGQINSMSTNQITKPFIEAVYYRFENSKKFFIKKNEIKDYVMEDNVSIHWDILDSLKTIEGIECQKAIGDFRGRNYIVWFASSIPSSSGPWKLGGLPGLIIEAHDNKNQIFFNFSGIENLSTKPYKIEIPQNAISISKKDFKKLEEAILNDPIGYINNTLGVILQPPPGNRPNHLKRSNNPIELTED